ncbi:MAG: glycosyl transferase [Actinomycetota bacterium]
MGDFFQNGVITTLHDLGNRPLDDLESDLRAWGEHRPMALVIPALASELDGAGLPGIVEVLSGVDFLEEIIIGLDRADEAGFERARGFFDALPTPHRILWNEGPRLRAVHEELLERNLAPLELGKGRNVWYCMGYFLASGRSDVLALHDADIVTYSRSMLARLLYPVASPTFGYAFCKGYYFRAGDDRLNGRVARLLVTPLVRALRQTMGPHPYLDYLDSFRYPLAGEFAMDADVVRGLRIPADWGLEIGVLSEVYRNYTARRVCQVDVADAYDHKHQEVGADDPTRGLHRMAIDISKSMVRKLAISGEVFSPGVFRTLKATYYRMALDMVDQYLHDAEMNGYSVDRHREEQLVELFAQAITTAGDDYLSRPMELPFMPSWTVVLDALPDVYEMLTDAVEADNA